MNEETKTPATWESQATITVTEAAEILGVSRGSAFAAVHRGELPVLRIGHRMLIPTPALRKMLEETKAS